MRNTAQDRVRKGPFAALLILLSLFMGSATAAAGADLRGPSTRLGSSRHNPATAFLASGIRNPLDDEGRDSAGGPATFPFGPAVVTETLETRPAAGFRPADRAAAQRPSTASYRARAPPAS
ncbi:MAG TPA: hypothetical protein VE891_05335 [Allosphingosinicella sp.]|nr:hypothetical protein [Allosphingosinicella sp.]